MERHVFTNICVIIVGENFEVLNIPEEIIIVCLCAHVFVYCVCPCVHEYYVGHLYVMHVRMLCVMSMVVIELPLSSFCCGLLTNSQLKFLGSSSPSVGMIIKELCTT